MYVFNEKALERLEQLRSQDIELYRGVGDRNLFMESSIKNKLNMMKNLSREDLERKSSDTTISGRLMLKRGKGKAGFGTIKDATGSIQIYVRQDSTLEGHFDVWKALSLGDIVRVNGSCMRTKSGEPTIRVRRITLLTKCIESLPDKHRGLSDVETCSRQRYLDLIVNDDTLDRFRQRHYIIQELRKYLDGRGFISVETPIMQTIPGGASAKPFETHHNALDMDLTLRIAPELFLKRLIVGGMDAVYEIGKNFRNEGISTKHNPEFTMVEMYKAYWGWKEMANFVMKCIRAAGYAYRTDRTVIGPPKLKLEFKGNTIDLGHNFTYIRFSEAVAEVIGINEEDVWDLDLLRQEWVARHPQDFGKPLPKTFGKWFELWFDKHIEHTLIQPTFITHYPVDISPLARRSEEDPRVTERFELFIGGMEIANGFSELTDPVDQAERFKVQALSKGDEVGYFDSDYIKALSYGLPPTAGAGIGIDRLIMLFTGCESIREVILFPLHKPKGE